MAEVYRAYHAQLDRYVAIKLLHPFLADDPEFKERFEREARNIAKLRHPNIVQVFDFDFDQEDESYYMVMELINGETLKDVLLEQHNSEEMMSLERVVQIMREAGNALSYAHNRSMIHRDVKPANLMVDEDGRVVLTDFGIAKIVTGNQYTASGGMVGTPAYMSPEQGLGEAGDERSDIYSLGVILYQLVTGVLPFDADTPLAVILQHLNEPLRSPSEIKPDLPDWLESVVMRSMEKDPDNRFQSADDMIIALDAGIKGQPVNLAPVGNRETASPPPSLRQTDLGTPTQPLPPGEDQFGGRSIMIGVGFISIVVALFVILGIADVGPLASIFNEEDPATETANQAEPTPTPSATTVPSDTPTATLDPSNLFGTVSVGSAAILDAPDRNSEQLGRALEGEEIRILGQVVTTSEDRFYLVTVAGVEGWMLQQQIRVAPGVTELAQVVTFAPTNTPTATSTPTSTTTDTPTPTTTDTPTETATPSPTTTDTPTNTSTATDSPSPTTTPTNTNSPSPTASPSNTATPTPTLTPNRTETRAAIAAITQTAQAQFFQSQEASTPTPNIQRVLENCDLEYTIISPENLDTPPGSSAIQNPRLVRNGDDWTLDLVVQNTSTCDWPANLIFFSFLEDLEMDVSEVDDNCISQSRIFTNDNLTNPQIPNILIEELVEQGESYTISLEGRASERFGCYFGTWEFRIPEFDLFVGDPLIIGYTVFGGQ